MNRTGFTSARVSKRLGRIRLRQARIQNGESFLSSKTQQIMKEQRAVSSRQLLFSLIPLVLTFHHLKYISPHGLTDPEFSFSVFFNLTQKATEKLGLNQSLKGNYSGFLLTAKINCVFALVLLLLSFQNTEVTLSPIRPNMLFFLTQQEQNQTELIANTRTFSRAWHRLQVLLPIVIGE